MSDLALSVQRLRPFVPAKDFGTSRSFYVDIGFSLLWGDDNLAELRLGAHSFLLQNYYVKELADNFMMHMLVADVDRWHARLASLGLAEKYRIKSPAPPKLEPWGLRVLYLTDPSGVLWHIAEPAKS